MKDFSEITLDLIGSVIQIRLNTIFFGFHSFFCGILAQIALRLQKVANLWPSPFHSSIKFSKDLTSTRFAKKLLTVDRINQLPLRSRFLQTGFVKPIACARDHL